MNSIKLTNSQRDFLTSRSLYPAFVGGRGAGKSFMMAYKCVLTVLKYNVDAWLCSPTEKQAKSVMMKNVDKILRDMGVKFSKTKVPPNITISNGPEIRFVTLKNPDVLVGPEIGFIGFDEFDTVDMATAEESWGKAGACLRQKCDVPGFMHQACVSTTPEGFVFVHKMWEKMANDSRTDLLKQMESEGISEKLDSSIRGYINSSVALRRFGLIEDNDRIRYEQQNFECKKYIDSIKIPDYLSLKLRMAVTGLSQYQLYRSPTEENIENLPDGYLEKLEEIFPPELWPAYKEGRFCNMRSGTVYFSFNRKTHHVGEAVNKYDELLVGCDFNVTKTCAVVFNKTSYGLVAVDEFIELKDTEYLCRAIKERYPDRRIVVFPDASGASRKTNSSETDISIIRKFGFHVRNRKKNPYVKDRVNACNCGFNTNTLMINTNSCPTLTEALEQQAYDKNGAPDKTCGHDHILDAMGYCVYQNSELSMHKSSSFNLENMLIR